MADWNQQASKDTFALQYTAFSKDAFFALDTSVASKRLADDGFILDIEAIDALRSLKFLPLSEADKIRAKDLNAIHAGLMGAVEKLMKVYGATRIASDSTNDMSDRVKKLDTDMKGVQRTLHDDNFKRVVAVLKQEDLPALLEKLRLFKSPPGPTDTTDQSELEESLHETEGDDSIDGGDQTTDETGGTKSPRPEGDGPPRPQPRSKRDLGIDTLLHHLEDIVYGVSEVESLRKRMQNVEDRLTELSRSVKTVRDSNSANSDFITTHRHKIDTFDPKALQTQISDLEKAIQSLPEHQIVTGTQGPTGTIKAPHLATLEPSEYRAFRDMYKAHAQVHKWSESVAKQQLLLSVDPKIYSTLKSAVPDWSVGTLEEALTLWDKRIVPASVISYAVLQLSGLEQKMEEDTISYFTRGEELYKQAQPVDRPQASPETDEQFVLRLVNGLRDKRLIDHVRRRLDQDPPFTMSKLRAAVNVELCIQALNNSSAPSGQAVGAFDGMKSFQKMSPPCDFCKDKKHATAQCKKLFQALRDTPNLQLPQTRNQTGGNGGGNKGKGKRGGGRGGGQKNQQDFKKSRQDSNQAQKPKN